MLHGRPRVAGKQARRKKDTTAVEARMIFLLNSNMIQTKANFTGQFINDLLCEICGKEENTEHLLECEGYTEIRKISELKIHQ